MDVYQLEKAVWSEKDFEVMGWHDATIYSTVADPEKYEFLIDLDYIFSWVHPKIGEQYFKFWIAPVTMVFENVYNVKIDIESRSGFIEVADFYMENPQLTPNKKFTSHDYRFDCQEGEISLQATAFKMYVRQNPKFVAGQRFDLEERGGVNFGRELID